MKILELKLWMEGEKKNIKILLGNFFKKHKCSGFNWNFTPSKIAHKFWVRYKKIWTIPIWRPRGCLNQQPFEARSIYKSDSKRINHKRRVSWRSPPVHTNALNVYVYGCFKVSRHSRRYHGVYRVQDHMRRETGEVKSIQTNLHFH